VTRMTLNPGNTMTGTGRKTGSRRHLRSALPVIVLLAAVFVTAPSLATAGSTSGDDMPDSGQTTTDSKSTAVPGRISAFAWIRPKNGVLVLTGPSTDFGYRIDHLDVGEGDMVEAGQALAELDVNREREANLAVARAQVSEAEVDADFAARELDRKEKLIHVQTPVISVHDLDAIRQIAQVASAKLEVAKRQESYAEIMLEQTIIRSPADGMILRILKHEGEGFTPGQGLIELGRVDHMEAVAEVFETDIRYVEPGQPATFESPALAGPVHGKVLRIMPKLDRITLYETSAGENVENRVVRVVIDLGDDPAVTRMTGLQGIVTIDTSTGP